MRKRRETYCNSTRLKAAAKECLRLNSSGIYLLPLQIKKLIDGLQIGVYKTYFSFFEH